MINMEFLMMLMLQMMLELWGLVCCFVSCVVFLFVLKVIVSSVLPLLCVQQVLLRGVSVSPLLCSSFTQHMSSSTKFLLA